MPAAVVVADAVLSLPALAALSDEEVKEELLTWAGRVAAGEARLLAYVGELDARGAWADWGVLSCAHWLSWRLGLSLQAGYERVRVARALRELPLTAAEFHAGRLSYSQVRAVTRAAGPADERDWVALARVSSGSQLDRLARGVRRARRIERADREPWLADAGMVSSVRYDDDGTMVLTVRLPAEDGAVVLAAIEAARAELDRARQQAADAAAPVPSGCGQDSSAEDTHAGTTGTGTGTGAGTGAGAGAGVRLLLTGPVLPDWSDGGTAGAACGQDSSAEDQPPAGAAGVGSSRRPRVAPSTFLDGRGLYDPPQPGIPARASIGQAVLHLARRCLDQQAHEHPDAARRSRSRLQLLVDPLSGWARLPDGELLPARCTAPLLRDVAGWGLRPLTPLDLTANDLGRTAREPDLALRELLGRIDGERCRFPGCTRRRKLHAHHVVFWSDGGRTDLANLVLLCGRHHTLVHKDGYRLTLHPDRTLDVSTFDGQTFPHRPPLPWRPAAELDPQRRIDATTLPPHVTDRLDLHHAVWVLTQHAA